MGNIQDIGRYAQFVAWGTSGNLEDVDRLMDALEMNDDLATTKLVDYALGLVETREGRAQLSHYLFNGSQRLRNFASLYFKRSEKTIGAERRASHNPVVVEVNSSEKAIGEYANPVGDVRQSPNLRLCLLPPDSRPCLLPSVLPMVDTEEKESVRRRKGFAPNWQSVLIEALHICLALTPVPFK